MFNSVMDDLKKFPRGSVLFVEGEPSTFLYIIKSGSVLIVKEDGANLVPISRVGAKQFIGEISIFTDEARTACAVVESNLEVYLVRRSDIKKIIKTCPEWLSEIMETLCLRLKETTDILKEHKIVGDGSLVNISTDDEKIFIDAIKAHRSGRSVHLSSAGKPN